jgi:hypothetical protein
VFNFSRPARGALVGFFLIALGAIFMLDQFGLMRADFAFSLFWPAVLIAFGLVCVLQPPNRGRTFWGGLILLLGLMMMVNNLGIAHIRYDLFWPLWIIAAGVWMIARRSGYLPNRQNPPANWQATPPPPPPFPQPPGTAPPSAGPPSSGPAPPPAPGWQPPSWQPPRTGLNDWWNPGNSARRSWAADNIPPSMESTIDYTAVFHHIERRIVSQNFRGGKLSVVFGGFTIDLTQADMDVPVAVLHADAVFGGGEIFVPDTWEVSVHGSGVFGGYSNETRQRPPAGAAKRLIIEGAAVFGGIVVKN